MARPALASIVLTFIAAVASAEDVRVSAAFDREAAAPGESVTYTITISGESLGATRVVPAPDFSQFESVLGPSSGQSSEIRFVNGAMSKRENVSFSWQLATSRAGRASVPPCTFSVGSQQVTTQRADVLVDPNAPARGRARSGRRDPRRPWAEPVRRVGEGLSLRTEVSEAAPFVGQAIVVRDIVTLDANVSHFNEREAAEFSGFAKKRNSGIKIEVRRLQDPATGQVRSEAIIAEWVIAALTPGRRELAGHSYAFSLPSSDPMEALMGREVEVVRSSPPFVINVQPHPEGAPASFGGAIGAFQISASLAADSLEAGDGTQIIVVVRGKGSFESVSAPTLALPDGLKLFEPEIVEAVDFEADGQLAGRKTFTFPVLATRSGRYEIPAIDWAFLDPSSRRYVERRTEPLVLEAAGGGPDIVAALPAAPVDPFEFEASDLRHVRASLAPWRPDLAARGVPSWIIAVATAGPLVNLALMAWSMLARLRTTDPAVRRRQAAPALARRRLAEAADALRRGKSVEAADGAARAVAGLVSDHYGLGAALAPAEAAAALLAAGEADLARRVERFLSACDLARFANGGAADTLRLLGEAEELLSPLTRLKVSVEAIADRSA